MFRPSSSTSDPPNNQLALQSAPVEPQKVQKQKHKRKQQQQQEVELSGETRTGKTATSSKAQAKSCDNSPLSGRHHSRCWPLCKLHFALSRQYLSTTFTGCSLSSLVDSFESLNPYVSQRDSKARQQKQRWLRRRRRRRRRWRHRLCGSNPSAQMCSELVLSSDLDITTTTTSSSLSSSKSLASSKSSSSRQQLTSAGTGCTCCVKAITCHLRRTSSGSGLTSVASCCSTCSPFSASSCELATCWPQRLPDGHSCCRYVTGSVGLAEYSAEPVSSWRAPIMSCGHQHTASGQVDRCTSTFANPNRLRSKECEQRRSLDSLLVAVNKTAPLSTSAEPKKTAARTPSQARLNPSGTGEEAELATRLTAISVAPHTARSCSIAIVMIDAARRALSTERLQLSTATSGLERAAPFQCRRCQYRRRRRRQRQRQRPEEQLCNGCKTSSAEPLIVPTSHHFSLLAGEHQYDQEEHDDDINNACLMGRRSPKATHRPCASFELSREHNARDQVLSTVVGETSFTRNNPSNGGQQDEYEYEHEQQQHRHHHHHRQLYQHRHCCNAVSTSNKTTVLPSCWSSSFTSSSLSSFSPSSSSSSSSATSLSSSSSSPTSTLSLSRSSLFESSLCSVAVAVSSKGRRCSDGKAANERRLVCRHCQSSGKLTAQTPTEQLQCRPELQQQKQLQQQRNDDHEHSKRQMRTFNELVRSSSFLLATKRDDGDDDIGAASSCSSVESDPLAANQRSTSRQLPDACSSLVAPRSSRPLPGNASVSAASARLLSQSSKTLQQQQQQPYLDQPTTGPFGQLHSASSSRAGSPVHRNQLHNFYLHEFVLVDGGLRADWHPHHRRTSLSDGLRSSEEEEDEQNNNKNNITEDNNDDVDDDDERAFNDELANEERERLAENLADFAQRSGCVHCHCRHKLLVLVRNEQILNQLTLRIKQGGSANTVPARCAAAAAAAAAETSMTGAGQPSIIEAQLADRLTSASSGLEFKVSLTEVVGAKREKIVHQESQVIVATKRPTAPTDKAIMTARTESDLKTQIEQLLTENATANEMGSNNKNEEEDHEADDDGEDVEGEEEDDLLDDDEEEEDEEEGEEVEEEVDDDEEEEELDEELADVDLLSQDDETLLLVTNRQQKEQRLRQQQQQQVEEDESAVGGELEELSGEMNLVNQRIAQQPTLQFQLQPQEQQQQQQPHQDRSRQQTRERQQLMLRQTTLINHPPMATRAALSLDWTAISNRELRRTANLPETNQRCLPAVTPHKSIDALREQSSLMNSRQALHRQRRLAVSGASESQQQLSGSLSDRRSSDRPTPLSRNPRLVFSRRGVATAVAEQQRARTEVLNFYRRHHNNPNLVQRRHHWRRAMELKQQQDRRIDSQTFLQQVDSTTNNQDHYYYNSSGDEQLTFDSKQLKETTLTTRKEYQQNQKRRQQEYQRTLTATERSRAACSRSATLNENRCVSVERVTCDWQDTAAKRRARQRADYLQATLMPFTVDDAAATYGALDKENFLRMMNYGEMEAKPMVTVTRELIKKLMPKYKRHDDLIVIQETVWEEFKKSLPIPVTHDDNSPFSIDEDELASIVCQTIQKPPCNRLAIEKGIKSDDYRSPNVELLLGETGIVNHKENHIIYQFDVTKCMFSFGNINEKMRMASLDCMEETVVDLFAGIGYFSLPLLIHAKAKHLYACEWNPNAVDALRKNLSLNKIDPSRYTVIEGDNRSNRPTDVAQRVILGILPSSYCWMQTAFECINKTTGAILHCHDLVEIPKVTLGEKRTSASSLEVSTCEKPNSTSQSILNQCLSSSSSSHSTLEKLSAPSEDKTTSIESDKDTSSAVFLEKPLGSCNSVSNSSDVAVSVNTNDTSSTSSNQDDSISEQPHLADQEMNAFEARAQTLILKIKEDVEAHDLKIKLIHIQPVKSYAPHVTHVVFDIKIEPKSFRDIHHPRDPSVFSTPLIHRLEEVVNE